MDNHRIYRGKALVIGNNLYDQMKPDLENPVNDAKGIFESLQHLGFMTMDPAYDITIDEFDEIFNEFISDLQKYDAGILYFAGHGIEIEGKNYLIMKNTPKTDNPDSTIRYSADLQVCINKMHKTGCKMIIVIIDACRDNPFAGVERGWGSVNLAPIFAPKGTLIAYSTSPGERASEFGMEGHSVYTGALLEHLKEEGLEIETFFKKVRATVNALTSGKKTSWEHTSLIGTFTFNPGKIISQDELGYASTSIRDCDFDYSNQNVGRIISRLKTYEWPEQNEAISQFLKIGIDKLNPDELFVVGRNILQASVGDSYAAIDLIKDSHTLSKYTKEGKNHLLNGILFEIYFNHKGEYRYNNLKSRFLDDLIEYSTNENLKSSFEFIEKVLRKFSSQLIFIPSPDKKMIDFSVKIEKVKVTDFFMEEEEMDGIVSVSYEGYELLASDEDNNVFPYAPDWHVSKQRLVQILSEGYAIPQSSINLVFNIDIGNDNVWFNRKFKRNYK